MNGDREKSSLLVLGVSHMGVKGEDDGYQGGNIDVLGDQRQKEIRECVERLKAFQPTKVAVEFPAYKESELMEAYKRYQAGDFPLEADEMYQLGFRIASEMGHDTIYPVDWNHMYGDVALGHVFDFAKEMQPALYNRIKTLSDEHVHNYEQYLNEHTLSGALNFLNSDAYLDEEKEIYMNLAQVSDGEYYIGVDWLANYWYRRNMIIFNNLTSITSDNDRILVIYGAGHKHLLTQFAEESGLYQLSSVLTYLGVTE